MTTAVNIKESLRVAGQVVIDRCEMRKPNGEAFDLRDYIESITIFEDIFAPFISGKLMLRDTLDLPNIMGRGGNNLLHLTILTPSLDEFRINSYFVIYKMSDRANITHRTQVYNLWFASPEILIDVDSNISRQYSGTGDTIIAKIIEETFGDSRKLNVDKCANSLKYVSNFWSPTKNFAYIAEHSIGPRNSPTCLFFENRDGFNFKEISGLADKKIPFLQTFTGTDVVAEVQEEGVKMGNVTRNLDTEFSKILTIRVDKTFDYIDDYMNGAVKTRLYSNDVITKKIRANSFDMTQTRTELNDNQIYSPELVQSISPTIMVKDRGYGTFGLSESSNYQILQKRISYMRLLRSSIIEIDVYGRTDYTVGKKVLVKMNQLRDLSKDEDNKDILDKLYSGTYIITAMSHQITKGEHRCTLELCKESTLSL
jgi:hypothetical protein